MSMWQVIEAEQDPGLHYPRTSFLEKEDLWSRDQRPNSLTNMLLLSLDICFSWNITLIVA